MDDESEDEKFKAYSNVKYLAILNLNNSLYKLLNL